MCYPAPMLLPHLSLPLQRGPPQSFLTLRIPCVTIQLSETTVPSSPVRFCLPNITVAVPRLGGVSIDHQLRAVHMMCASIKGLRGVGVRLGKYGRARLLRRWELLGEQALSPILAHFGVILISSDTPPYLFLHQHACISRNISARSDYSPTWS